MFIFTVMKRVRMRRLRTRILIFQMDMEGNVDLDLDPRVGFFESRLTFIHFN